MRKTTALLIAAVLFFCQIQKSYAAASEVSSGKKWSVYRLFSSESVASTASISSDAIGTASDGYFGVYYIATSVIGSPDLKIEYEMSWDDNSSNFVEPDSASDIESSLTSETAKIKSVQPPPMPFMRIKVTGGPSNPSDTVFTMYLYKQEP